MRLVCFTFSCGDLASPRLQCISYVTASVDPTIHWCDVRNILFSSGSSTHRSMVAHIALYVSTLCLAAWPNMSPVSPIQLFLSNFLRCHFSVLQIAGKDAADGPFGNVIQYKERELSKFGHMYALWYSDTSKLMLTILIPYVICH